MKFLILLFILIHFNKSYQAIAREFIINDICSSVKPSRSTAEHLQFAEQVPQPLQRASLTTAIFFPLTSCNSIAL